MPNIKPISDLRNYNEVLRDVAPESPVFLTRNGRGRYVLSDIAEYEKQQAIIKLLAALAEGEASVKSEDDWMTLEEVRKGLGI